MFSGATNVMGRRYYRTYLELMRHWDAVLPGRILRVWYEDDVEDLEGNVRRILEFCGLEFEPDTTRTAHVEDFAISAATFVTSKGFELLTPAAERPHACHSKLR